MKDNSNENKKAKGTKKCAVKKNLKFETYKYCLEANQLENKINLLEKHKTDVSILREDHKQFIKNKIILKSQQRFRSEKYNVFTKSVNNIALSANDDKRIQSID